MKLQYFMPDWEDYLDADFDFQNDKLSTKTREGRREIYAHECLSPEILYDGMLLSLAHLTKKKGLLRNESLNGRKKHPIRDALRLPPTSILMGDCGAFSYISEKQPPITSAQAARLYERLGFDWGTSVDHLILPDTALTPKQRKNYVDSRLKLTTQNALEFIKIVKSRRLNFTPVGSIQGFRPEDYANSFDTYLDAGYEHVAVGSLVPKRDEEILRILGAINTRRIKRSDAIKARLHIHLFGILRPKLLPSLPSLGVTSFDSASYLRKAWLRSDKNYLSSSNKWYAAIRVPHSTDPRTKKQIDRKQLNGQDLAELEREALEALIDYGAYRLSLETTLKKVLRYDRMFKRLDENTESFSKAYKKTLADRPWEKCTCDICCRIGIHVIIFRGFNRNKRRGFHNTLMFYRQLKDLNERPLATLQAITSDHQIQVERATSI
jgi:hypothetical protein